MGVWGKGTFYKKFPSPNATALFIIKRVIILRVLLTTLNAKYIHSSLALRYLRAYLADWEKELPEAEKTEVYVKEYTINNQLGDILSDLYPLRPDLIGLACYIWNWEETLKLASLCKKALPGVKIVLGGPEVSFDLSGAYLEYVDYVVLGEGEEAFASLVAELRNNGGCQNIAGVLKLSRGEIMNSAQPQLVAELDDIPFPYDESDLIALKDKIIYYETSRGCPFSCHYCLSGAAAKLRFFSPERVLRDLAFFIKHDVAQVKFVDRTFNAQKKHYLPVLKFLAAQNCRTNFHLEVAAALWDEEGLEILKSAPPGRFQLEIGVQSTHEPTLKAVGREQNFAALAANTKRIAAYGNIHLHLDLIAALPYEGKDIFARSFNDVYALRPDMLQLGFLKLLKGSELRKNAAQHGYVFMDNAPYEVLANNYLSYAEIRSLKLIEKVLSLVYNSSRFKYSLDWLIAKEANAFAFYEKLAAFWEAAGLELAAHSPVTLYKFMADFSQQHFPQFTALTLQFLKFDYLLTQKNTNLPVFLPFNDELKWREVKNSFWQDTTRVRRYLPNFTFTTWRELKKNYHLEIFTADLPAFF
ncbi:MAG: B12-binding domain-containing radical SAM protein, partial [Sporomusaceae bacterium]|nr:B12-binding domain-containing radical SAM protein [Sporomusaceae bacterium]